MVYLVATSSHSRRRMPVMPKSLPVLKALLHSVVVALATSLGTTQLVGSSPTVASASQLNVMPASVSCCPDLAVREELHCEPLDGTLFIDYIYITNNCASAVIVDGKIAAEFAPAENGPWQVEHEATFGNINI